MRPITPLNANIPKFVEELIDAVEMEWNGHMLEQHFMPMM